MDNNLHYRHIDNMILLRSCPLFSDLAPSELQRLVLLVKEHRYGYRETILQKGSDFDHFYLVKQGSCSLGEKLFEEGESVLESAVFLEEYTISNALIAESELVLVSIAKEDIYELLENNPSTSIKLVEWFASQMIK